MPNRASLLYTNIQIQRYEYKYTKKNTNKGEELVHSAAARSSFSK